MTSFGRMDKFSVGGDWDTYAERLEYYFQANSIDNTEKRKAVLLSGCWADTFSMLKNIITPRNIKALSFEELSDALSEHCNPAPSVKVERSNFYMYRQEPNQSISDFIARLKKLSQYCEFGDTIEDMLRDLTVVGVADDRIRRRRRKS